MMVLRWPRRYKSVRKRAMNSCIYAGKVRHRRFRPARHEFQYSLFWLYLDLDELPEILRRQRLLSDRKLAVASFRRSDHLGDASTPLLSCVHDFVESETGLQLRGPVRLLTQLRHFGLYFSPVNLFYCFDDAGQTVQAIVAEVSNTPWNQRHCYVLWDGNRTSEAEGHRFAHRKQFHVSPFMEVDGRYEWNLQTPGDGLDVSIACVKEKRRFFDASMSLRRRRLSDVQLARCLLRFPLTTVQTVGAIYYQAFRLWMKKCPFYPHPDRLDTAASQAG